MPEGVISATTGALLRWAAGTGLTVAAGPPPPEPVPKGQAAQAHCWLLALLPEQELRPGAGANPVRLRLRYLLCAARPGDLEPLDRLLVACVGGLYQPVFEAVPAPLWAAVGAPPRPAFFVEVVVHVDRPRPAVPRVTEPLRLHAVALREVAGVVLGPGDVPLPGMRVEAGDGLAAADTDAGGRFVLPGLPAGRPFTLRLSGRGRRFHHQVPADDPRPAVIRCEFRED
ncbi:carboxypeptidase-like regulatory domain-containing protein [Dactylosporangium darangshiense]|uniref:Carboxypeptidase regulatory-like domain-containing protein n=1 Tax=Dactylosporangium darangshiense TaxID=579108 RepID=A0ABP8D8W2_9ACTN